jgi:protein TonB
MVRDIIITRTDWCELVFNGKNKEYGAYALREDSGRRHLLAYLGVVAFTLLVIIVPRLAGMFTPAVTRSTPVTGAVTLVDLAPRLEEENKVLVTASLPVPRLRSVIKYTIAQITRDEEVHEEEMLTQDELNNTRTDISVANVIGNDENGEDIADLPDHQAIIGGAEDPVFFNGVVEQAPEFIGGDRAMRRWIGKRLKYPSLAEQNQVQGVVIVQFVVGRDGQIREVEVVRSVDPLLDTEAVRMVSEMPAWNPGKQGGVPVSVRFTMPVAFRLQEE